MTSNDNARLYLRHCQEYWTNAAQAVTPSDPFVGALQHFHTVGTRGQTSSDTLGATLTHAFQRERDSIRDGDYIRVGGGFKYKVATEEARWARTREIIQRIVPGPHEEPRFLEMLARQAASIELSIEASAPTPTTDPFPRIIFGTTAAPTHHAFTKLVDGAVFIAMSAGMIDLLYQTSKSIVLSWKPIESPEGVMASFSVRAEDIDEVLTKDPYPTDVLHDTFATWLYEGYPRAWNSRTPPTAYHSPLGMLINGAERFVLAHEYAHALLDLLQPMDQTSPHARELRADHLAMLFMSSSSSTFDLLPLNMALEGAVLVMKSNQVFDAAVEVARTGQIQSGASLGLSRTHPAFEQRIAQLEGFYLEGHPDPATARAHMTGMLMPVRTIDALWKRVLPRLRAHFLAGRRLHGIWSRQDPLPPGAVPGPEPRS